MTVRKILMWSAVAAVCLASAAAQAQQGGFTLQPSTAQKPGPILTNEVEIGAQFNTGNSFKFGEYTGFESNGFFAIGNITLGMRDPHDGPRGQFWRFSAQNLGLDSRQARAEFGRQGRFKLFLDFSQLPKFGYNDAQTPFLGDGNLSLPAGFVLGAAGATGTATMTNLAANLRTIEIKHERIKFGGGFAVNLGDWRVTGKYHHETKDGKGMVAGITGTNGGNPLSAILPMPIHFNTDQMNVGVEYRGKKAQFQVNYTLSLFNNSQDSLTWQSPFLTGANNGPGGRMALAPDNQFHKIALTGGYNMGRWTRIIAHFAYSQMRQNDSFQPFTNNPALAVAIPLPEGSLNGRIDTMTGNLSFVTRPTRRSNVRFVYRLNYRDNMTPRNVYVVVRNDSADQQAINSTRARVNRPYSFRHHQVKIDGGYRIAKGVKGSLGYRFDHKYRTLSERDTTREHSGKAKLRVRPFRFLSGWVSYEHKSRTGSNYDNTVPHIEGLAPAVGAALVGFAQFEQNPQLRKTYLANRDADFFKGAVTLTPHPKLQLTLIGRYGLEDYKNTEVGVTDRHSMSVTADASYAPLENVALHIFYAHQRGENTQKGTDIGGTISLVTINDPTLRWRAETTDRVHTVGVGGEWTTLVKKLKLKFDYTYTHAMTSIDVVSGPGATPLGAETPDLVTRIHALSLSGDYTIRKNSIVRVGYRFENFSTRDFALDNVGPATLGRVLGLGESSPNYTAHVVGISFIQKF